MKNKNLQLNNKKKGQQKTLNVPNPPKIIKNREELRKKLKDLLAKQVISPEQTKNTSKKPPKAINLNNKGNHNILPKDKQNFEIKTKSPKQNGNEKVQKEKNRKTDRPQGNKDNQKLQRQLKNLNKKDKHSDSSNDANSKPDNTSLKRKISKKAKPPEKGSTLLQTSKTFVDKAGDSPQLTNGKKKTKKPIQPPQKKTKKELPKTCVDKAGDSPQLTNGKKKTKKPIQPPQKKTKKEPVQKKLPKTKNAKLSKPKPMSAQKNTNSQQQYVKGLGPLRPAASDSELDGDNVSVDCQESGESSPIDKPKTEHALVRANNEFEASDAENKNTIFDFLFGGNGNDHTGDSFAGDSEYDEEDQSEFEFSDDATDSGSESFDGCEEYSDDETWEGYTSNGDDYFDTTDDDESYKPDENIPEDVYIAQGTAIKYELPNNDVGFDSDSSTQIIELPSNSPERGISKPPTKQNKLTIENDDNSNEDSDDSCPDLVPIQEQSESEYSSSSQSHSCCSDCSCDMSDEYLESMHSEQNYEPMKPEIISAEASDVAVDGIDNMFNCSPANIVSSASILEEITDSSVNPMKFKVYTINNETVSRDSFATKKTTDTKDRATQIEANTNKVNDWLTTSIATQTEDLKITGRQNATSKKVATQTENQYNSGTIVSDSSSQTTTSKKVTFPQEKVISEIADNIDKEEIRPATPLSKDPPADSFDKEKSAFRTPLRNELLPPSPKPSPLPTEKPSPLGKFTKSNTQIRTLFFNAINCNQVIVLLKDPLYFYGTVKLKLLAGCVNIFGYNPKLNEVVELFSPRGYSFLKLEPSQSSGERALLNEKQILSLTPFFIRSELEEIVDKFDHSKDAILILERNDRSKKISMLRKYMVEHLFPNMNSIQSDRPFYTSEFLLRCIITPRTDTPLIINPEWNHIRVDNKTRTMIIGGKSVGKSTLLRYLVNKNLNQHQKILLIDLDIGQPEMFVPQTMSATTLTEPLLGPGYLLTKQPDKSFLVGDISVVQSLQAYIESLKALIDYCNGNTEYKEIPWMVNTMGYNKGFGDELISVICSLLQPSNIVQLESQKEINDFDVIMMKDNVKAIERDIVGDVFQPSCEFDPQHQLTLVKAFVPKTRYPNNNEWNMKPREMRLAMILSRLSCILIGHAEWLTDVKPICASIDDLHIIKMGDDQMDKEDLVKTLVGNLVYLCRLESGKAHECLGIGIVRGIDFPLRQIYLLPSIPHSQLVNVNCLAICGIPLPSSILLNQGPKVKGTASYVYNTLDEAASMYIKHMINKPQSYSTGKRRYLAK